MGVFLFLEKKNCIHFLGTECDASLISICSFFGVGLRSSGEENRFFLKEECFL